MQMHTHGYAYLHQHIHTFTSILHQYYTNTTPIIHQTQLPVEERQGIPHHLLDVLDVTTDDFSAGAFYTLARQAADDILQVCEGLGVYLWRCVEGVWVCLWRCVRVWVYL